MDTSDNNDVISDTLSVVVEASPMAYVRPVPSDKGTNYAVCSADGTQLALFSTQDAAFFAAKQHDLEPVLLH